MQHDFDFIAERNGNRYLPRERERESPRRGEAVAVITSLAVDYYYYSFS